MAVFVTMLNPLLATLILRLVNPEFVAQYQKDNTHVVLLGGVLERNCSRSFDRSEALPAFDATSRSAPLPVCVVRFVITDAVMFVPNCQTFVSSGDSKFPFL